MKFVFKFWLFHKLVNNKNQTKFIWQWRSLNLVISWHSPRKKQLNLQQERLNHINRSFTLTGILLSELSNIISTKAEITLGPVPSWRRACLCSGRRWLNSSDRTNWIAGEQTNTRYWISLRATLNVYKWPLLLVY